LNALGRLLAVGSAWASYATLVLTGGLGWESEAEPSLSQYVERRQLDA